MGLSQPSNLTSWLTCRPVVAIEVQPLNNQRKRGQEVIMMNVEVAVNLIVYCTQTHTIKDFFNIAVKRETSPRSWFPDSTQSKNVTVKCILITQHHKTISLD